MFLEKNLVQNHYYLHCMVLFKTQVNITAGVQKAVLLNCFCKKITSEILAMCKAGALLASHREVFCGGPKGTGQIIFGSGFVCM